MFITLHSSTEKVGNFRLNSGGVFKTLRSVYATYDNKLDVMTADLTAYKGQRLFLILEANSGSNTTYDWAIWTEAKITATTSYTTNQGWNPGLTKRRAVTHAGVNQYTSLFDSDSYNRSYLLIVVAETLSGGQYWTNGGITGPSYLVNSANQPFYFDWGADSDGSGYFANLLLSTTGKKLSPLVSNHDDAFTYFGFMENMAFDQPAEMPNIQNVKFSCRLFKDGPYSIRFTSDHPKEDGRIVVGIVWRDSDSKRYIVEITLHSLNRTWRNDKKYVSNSTHNGVFDQFLILGGTAWGLGALNNQAWKAYNINWASILMTAKNEGQLKAPLGANSQIIEMGAGMEVRGEVDQRLIVSNFLIYK